MSVEKYRNVVIYARGSRSQVHACREHAEAQGWKVASVVEEKL